MHIKVHKRITNINEHLQEEKNWFWDFIVNIASVMQHFNAMTKQRMWIKNRINASYFNSEYRANQICLALKNMAIFCKSILIKTQL